MLCKVVSSRDDFLKCIKLAGEHYNEVERGVTGLPYKPKEGVLLAAFDGGAIDCVGLYDGEEIVGYVIVVVTPSFLCDATIASELGMYVKPEYRGGGWFKEMLHILEGVCSADVLEIKFKRQCDIEGYTVNDYSYIRRL
jgi:GNAT superfamily N-acetyltransferase